MHNTYIPRTIEATLTKVVGEFPAVVMTGPRQSGKTTLLKHLLGEDYSYLSMDLPEIRAAAADDPRGFLEAYPAPVILDEVQYAPQLLPYIKNRIDYNRGSRGQFILTGSQNLLLMEQVTESLAGRSAILHLYPLSHREEVHEARSPAPLMKHEKGTEHEDYFYSRLWEIFIRGNYPEPVTQPDRDIPLWHSSYIQTYQERDVRLLRNIGDLTLFRNFLQALAVRSGQLLNYADMSRDLGIALNTVKAWISILETSHQVTILRPYHTNVGKRLVKTPKVYFNDVGTLCHLIGFKDPDSAQSSSLAGAIFETAVVAEIQKYYLHRGDVPRIFFWRTSQGKEVDILIEEGTRLIPVEARLSATPRPSMARSIHQLKELIGNRVEPGYVIHAGDIILPLGGGTMAIPFSRI